MKTMAKSPQLSQTIFKYLGVRAPTAVKWPACRETRAGSEVIGAVAQHIATRQVIGICLVENHPEGLDGLGHRGAPAVGVAHR